MREIPVTNGPKTGILMLSASETYFVILRTHGFLLPDECRLSNSTYPGAQTDNL